MAQPPQFAQFGHQWHWETAACDCCGGCNCTDCGVCLKGLFCPCIMYAENKLAIEGRQGDDCCGPCCCYCFLSFFCLECCVAKNTRSHIRDTFGLRAEGCCDSGDCMTHFCCARCSLCQEKRELNMRLRAAAAGQQTAMVAPQQQFMTGQMVVAGGPQPYAAHYPPQHYPTYPPHDKF
ncbi:hypothetical protein ABPG77_004815 [Micractinium sp. CCAP 211/92]